MSQNLNLQQSDKNEKGKIRYLKNVLSDQEMQSEWEEIQAAQKDPRAFAPIYNRHYTSIFKFLFARTADENLSSEICSQVFLKALKTINSYEFRGVPFASWLFRIASNQLGQHYRKTNKMRVVNIEDQAFPELSVEGNFELDDGTNYEVLKEALVETLDELKEKDLKVIEMRFFEKRPFKEIAEILEITESNAKMRTYRILERMKKIILKKKKQ